MPRMKLECTCIEGEYTHFTYNQITTLGVTEKFFKLTEAEIVEMKGKEYPTLPNRYDFGMIEVIVGKMVLTMNFLYMYEDFEGKTIEIIEKVKP